MNEDRSAAAAGIGENLRVRRVAGEAATLVAALHRECLGDGTDRDWDAESVARLMALPASFAHIGERSGAPVGFVQCLAVPPAVDLAAIGVVPGARRKGVADRLLTAAVETARASGAEVMMLEVAADNGAAVALYRKHGFAEAGRRPGYYARPDGRRDALVMRLWLGGPPGPSCHFLDSIYPSHGK